MLATSLAVHFVNSVQKASEIWAMFGKFVELYNDPVQTLSRLPSARQPLSPNASSGAFPKRGDGFAWNVDIVGEEVEVGDMEEELVSPPHTTGVSPQQQGDSVESAGGRENPNADADKGGPPWAPLFFSASFRAVVRDGFGHLNSSLPKLYAHMQGGECGEDNSGKHLPNVLDFRTMAEFVEKPLATMLTTEQPLLANEWLSAGCLLHYKRLSMDSCSGDGKPTANSKEGWGDPLRPEVQRAGTALSWSMKTFAHAEHQERRKPTRRWFHSELGL